MFGKMRKFLEIMVGMAAQHDCVPMPPSCVYLEMVKNDQS